MLFKFNFAVGTLFLCSQPAAATSIFYLHKGDEAKLMKSDLGQVGVAHMLKSNKED